MIMPYRPEPNASRLPRRTPTGDAADRWLRARGAHAVPCTPRPAPGLSPRQYQALHLAPRLVTGDPQLPPPERWRHFLQLPAVIRQQLAAGRNPQPLTLCVPDHTGAYVRCLYRLVVLDEEVVLLPAIVRVSALQVRVFGGREPYAPGTVPPPGQPAYDMVWTKVRELQAQFDYWQDRAAAGSEDHGR